MLPPPRPQVASLLLCSLWFDLLFQKCEQGRPLSTAFFFGALAEVDYISVVCMRWACVDFLAADEGANYF
jgi:hypothetical protein